MGRGLDVFSFYLVGLRAVFKPRRMAGRRRAEVGGASAGSTVFGGNSEGDTPLPIPNRAVKPLSADGTWWETAWESRSPPVLTETIPTHVAHLSVVGRRRCGRRFRSIREGCR